MRKMRDSRSKRIRSDLQSMVPRSKRQNEEKERFPISNQEIMSYKKFICRD